MLTAIDLNRGITSEGSQTPEGATRIDNATRVAPTVKKNLKRQFSATTRKLIYCDAVTAHHHGIPTKEEGLGRF
jgi:hypothetical protein